MNRWFNFNKKHGLIQFGDGVYELNPAKFRKHLESCSDSQVLEARDAFVSINMLMAIGFITTTSQDFKEVRKRVLEIKELIRNEIIKRELQLQAGWKGHEYAWRIDSNASENAR